jgi:hypothetical protein
MSQKTKEKGWRRRLVSVFPDLESEGTAFAACRRRFSRCSLRRVLLASTLVIIRRLGTRIPGLGGIVSRVICGGGRSGRFAILSHLELQVFKARKRK